MRTESPCYGCAKRVAECHAFCGEYRAWSAARAKAREEQFQAKETINAVNGIAIARSIRLKKMKG